MRKTGKRFFTLMMAGCLAFSGSGAYPAAAAEGREVSAEAAMVTRVTEAVKEKITIPKSMVNFDYDIESGKGQRTFISLSWSNKKYTKFIRIIADNGGRIYSYINGEEGPDYDKTAVPNFGRKEMQRKAEAFISKASPGLQKKLSLQESSFTGPYTGSYRFLWVRKENGILIPQNTVGVEINATTGKVERYSADWSYGLSLPQEKETVTKAQAKGKIEQAMNMELKYFIKTNWDDDSGEPEDEAYLAYAPDLKEIAVDAITGEVYTSDNDTFFEEPEAGKNEAESDAGSAMGEETETTVLTEKEIESILEISGILSEEEAEEAVKNAEGLLLPEGMSRTSARLYQSAFRQASANYVWALSFQTTSDKEDSLYTRAVVDAENGRILSFYTSRETALSPAGGEAQDGRENGRKRMEAFIKQQAPEYASLVTFIGQTEEKGENGDFYVFGRCHNGILVEGNGIYGSVDRTTGKLYRYNISWSRMSRFESADGVIGEKKAFDFYMSYPGFEKLYEINNPYSTTPRARLVYRAEITPDYVSAKTGKQLDYKGEVYKPEEKHTYRYTDISGSPWEESILLLADMDIGLEGSRFRPNQAVKRKELKTLLLSARFYGDLRSLEKDGTITRLEAARLAIKILNLDKAAKLSDTYRLELADADKIAAGDRGCVALAIGLKLLKKDGKNRFCPERKLTRGEAAGMLVEMLRY